MKKIGLFVFALFLFTLLLPSPGVSQTSIKIGALIPFSGRWGDSGRECAKGMLDAGRWLNQRGGIFGRRIEIVLIEDTAQPAEIMAAYRKLNETDRIPLFYIYSAETAVSLFSYIHLDRIPTIVSSLPSYATNAAKHPYIFTLLPTPFDLSRIVMKYVLEGSGIKVRKPKILFVGSPNPLSRQLFDEMKTHAKASGFGVGPDVWIPDGLPPAGTPSGEASNEKISLLLAAAISFDPDYTFLNLTSREAFLVLQEARKLRSKAKWICSRKALDETLTPLDDILGVQPVSPFGEDVPGMVGLKEVHQKWHPYDSHTNSFVEGWGTVQVMAEVLGRSLPEQRFTRERVKGSLEGLKDFVTGGLFPPITITPTDHRPSLESRIFTIKDGKISRHTSFISFSR